jgi:hypothetical protein
VDGSRSASRIVRFVPILLAAALIAGLLITPAGAAPCSKTYSVSRTAQNPDPWPAGGTGTFTLSYVNTISNNCTSVSIGSIEISVPPGWTVTGVQTFKGGTATPAGWAVDAISPSVRTHAASGTAKIANGQELDIVVSATTSCEAGTGAWRSTVWVGTTFTSSQFSTNDQDPTTAIQAGSGCHLAFIRQPATTEKNTHITSVAGDLNGAPIQVGAFAGDSLVTSFTGKVTLAIGANPGVPAGTLSPTSVTTTGVSAVGGIATFTTANLGSSLSINILGHGYTLVASAMGFSTAESDSDPGSQGAQGFDIVDDYVDCTTQTCTGAANNGTGTSTQVSAPTGDPTFLSVSILPSGSLGDCAGYQAITGTVSWITDASGDQIVTIVADGALIKKSLRPPDQGAAHFQVCYQTDPGKPAFTDRSGNSTNGPALLPDCSGTITTNCVFFRNKTQAGSAVIQFKVADGRGKI